MYKKNNIILPLHAVLYPCYVKYCLKVDAPKDVSPIISSLLFKHVYHKWTQTYQFIETNS